MSRTARRVRLVAVAATGVLGTGSAFMVGQLPASAASIVAINAGTTYQRIDGFGVSEAFGQANSIRSASAGTQRQALDLLFNTASGAGFSILRSIIPSGSDSIEPTLPGGPSANGGALCGTPGASCGSGDWRRAYANYLTPTTQYNTGGKPLWESEWGVNGSTWNTSWDDGSESAGFTWAQRVQTGLTRANLNTFLHWWGVSSTGHDSALIGLSGTSLKVSKRYYALANFSRFIRPGAVRIGATGGDSNPTVSAYRNGDGSTVIVVLNTGRGSVSATYTVSGRSSGTATPYLTNANSSTAAQSSIALRGGSFTATVPARSLVTYRIP